MPSEDPADRLIARCEPLLAEYADLERRLADPAVHADPALARRLGRRYAELTGVIEALRAWQAARDDLAAGHELAEDDESFASELPGLADAEAKRRERLRSLLIP